MLEKVILRVAENRFLVPHVYEMRLEGDLGALSAPGQFVNLAIEGLFLRRPISVCDYDAHHLTLLYKVVGEGTHRMSLMPVGAEVEVLAGLGNGFTVEQAAARALLAGGGIGIAPLYRLAKDLVAAGKEVTAVLGFNVAAEAFYLDEFRATGAQVYVATMDGSMGTRGFVTDAIREQCLSFDYFYACGPMPMLGALCKALPQEGQLSLEARMGCGFGACMGCSLPVAGGGSKRVCKEGPVFRKEELVW